jgi:hypothetical protein
MINLPWMSRENLKPDKTMKIEFSRLPAFLPVMLLTAFTSGCATPALWDRTSEFQWKPLPIAQVVVITDTNHQSDTVIVFKQSANIRLTHMFREVGWRVSQSADELAVTHQAIRQLTNSVGGSESLTVYRSGKVSINASSQPPGYAVLDSTNEQITIHRDGLPPGPYTLPPSTHPKNTTLRVVLTPLALAADVPMCAFGLFVYVFIHL